MARHRCAKTILELRRRGMSVREIEATRHVSHHTVKEVCDRAKARGLTWEAARLMGEDEVASLLFPEEAAVEEAAGRPDWDDVHRQLAGVGVTLKLLWEEYRDSCRQSGKASISYTTFTREYGRYVTARSVTNHLEHRPGEVMEVDWSGPTMRLADPVTGEITKAYLFVAVLPYSQYTYVEATSDMRQNAWLLCHVHAYDFFEGVAIRLVCDNLKTGVTSHPRPKDGEVVLNEAYEELGRHYRCAITPADVRKPKQKPSVEGGVGKIATAVIARLRDRTFPTLPELNQAIRECLAEYNARPFQKREGSRESVFSEVERPALSPLPATPFEPSEWVYGRKVALDFHVAFETNRYSVPHALVGRKVDLKVTTSAIEVFCQGERVATHPRLPESSRYRYSTEPSHMPPEFCLPEWDEPRMRRWARSVGPDCETIVGRVFSDVQIREQAYNPVMAILNLSKTYGDEALEGACSYALKKGLEHPRSRFLRSVLASGAWKAAGAGKKEVHEQGGYVRGFSYYAGGEPR